MKKWLKTSFSLFLMLTMLLSILPVGVFAAEEISIDLAAQYRLVNKATGKMLIRSDDNTYVPGRADVYKVAAAPYDTENSFGKWKLNLSGGDKYQLVNLGSGVAGLHKTNESYDGIAGANHVVTVDNYRGPQQNFTLIDAGDGYVRLCNPYEETGNSYDEYQYLSVTADRFNGSTDTVFVCLTAESHTDNQLWKLEQVEGTGTQPLPELDEFQPRPLYTGDTLTVVKPGSVDIDGFVDEGIRHAQDHEVKIYDWDRLVNPFRNHTDGGFTWRGEFWGKQMRAASFQYAYTQDAELYAVMEATVRDLLTTQDPDTGRIGSYPTDWDVWDVWCRKYVMLGLESFYSVCKDEALKKEVLTALCYHADYILARLGPATEGKTEITSTGYWNGIASCSILEPMVMLYNLTGFQRYLDFATYIVNTGCTKDPNVNLFELAYECKVMPSLWYKGQSKAYEMTSCFEGLAEYYRVTGEEKWKIACLNYYRLVSDHEITIAGSGSGQGSGAGYSYYNGNVEHWNNLAVNQSDPTLRQTQETCVTVAWMKYCFQMLRLVGESEVADDLEISIYNALFAALKAEGVETSNWKFIFDYFNPLNGQKLNPGGVMYDSEGALGCCCPAAGHSGMGLIPFIGVMNRADGPVINLYHDSTVTTDGVTLDITGNYPFEDTVTVTVTPETPREFTLSLRIPAWSEKTVVTLNGVEQTGVTAGAYFSIKRQWNAGDVITLQLDLRTRLVEDPAGFDKVALMRGPIVLARDSRFGDGEVTSIKKVAADENGYVAAAEAEPVFDSNLTLSVPCKDGSSVLFCDYASAGQTWTGESRYAVWMSTTSLSIEENVPYYLYCHSTGAAVTIKAGTDTVYKNTLPAEGEVVSDRIWVFEKAGNNWLIRNPETNLYITAAGKGDGAKLELKPYAGDDTQQWKVVVNGKTTFQLINAFSGTLFSEVGDEGDGTGLHLWRDVNNPVQWYTVTPAGRSDAVAAAEVDALIEAIDVEDKATIDAARDAYNALNNEARALVTRLAELEAAELHWNTVNSPVSLILTGDESVSATDGEAVYTLSAEGMHNLASMIVNIAMPTEYLSEPVAAPADGWMIVVQTWEDGVLQVVLANNTGANGDGDILTVTVKVLEKAGNAVVTVTEAELAAYLGEGETFVKADLTAASVTTVVEYNIFDVNKDGTVNLLDLTRAQRHYDTDNKDADVNKDQTVNIDDLILILNNYTTIFA